MIPVYEPYLSGEEEKLVQDCIRSSWISSGGKYIREFEEDFARRCDYHRAVAVMNGTAALHLTLHALGIGPGDEVLVPTLTFVATANAVRYTGATPVFVDSERETWNISVEDAERKVTSRTRAVIPVHLYGHPAKMDEIQKFARTYDLKIIEDAAQAHFARIGNRYAGTFGAAGTFSFYGNKIITTGEGGMIITADDKLADRLRFLRDHAMSRRQRYWHTELGFNYRMTNLQAAVGVAQLRKLDYILDRKAQIAAEYRELLQDIPGIILPPNLPGYTNIYWLFSILIETGFGLDRDHMIMILKEKEIDSRPLFPPIHTMPMYKQGATLPVAEDLASKGISLPSSPALSAEDVMKVAKVIRGASCHG